MHGLLLVGLAFAGYRVHREVQREFRSGGRWTTGWRRIRRIRTWTSRPSRRRRCRRRGRSPRRWRRRSPRRRAPPAAFRSRPRRGREHARWRPELAKLDVRRATEVVVPTATMLGQTVSIRGNGAEMVGGVEGAVDRIAIEILRQLEQGPHPGRLGVRRLGKPPGRAAAAGQAHRDGLHPHQPARREPAWRPTTDC